MKASQAQCVPIITKGQFEGYLSSRDTAAMIGRQRSGGHMRAEGWARVPIVRMSNVSILPGEKPLSFDELIGSTDDGIYMETNRSWSIDDKRYNFQFGCEAGVGDQGRQAGTDAAQSIVLGDYHGVLEFDGRDLRPAALDAVGNSELRQGTAGAGHGNRTWRGSGAVPAGEGGRSVRELSRYGEHEAEL